MALQVVLRQTDPRPQEIERGAVFSDLNVGVILQITLEINIFNLDHMTTPVITTMAFFMGNLHVCRSNRANLNCKTVLEILEKIPKPHD